MRIAFYAPLKPPDSPRPSGDRRMARLLIAALEGGGNTVELACRLRSRDGTGYAARQDRLAAIGARAAAGWCGGGQVDLRVDALDAWVTYHLYYKAPDHLGPVVSQALNIPYVAVEASHAPKRANGPWATSHAAVERALGTADLVVGSQQPGQGLCRPGDGSARALSADKAVPRSGTVHRGWRRLA